MDLEKHFDMLLCVSVKRKNQIQSNFVVLATKSQKKSFKIVQCTFCVFFNKNQKIKIKK